MKRRYFVTGLTTIGLSACQFLPRPSGMKIQLLSNSIPSQFIREFERLNQVNIEPKPHRNYSNLLEQLDRYSPLILGIGDAWLPSSVDLLQEIDPQKIPNFGLIPAPWQSVGNLKGKLYAIPYRWGTTVIAYNENIFNRQDIPPITTWQGLWHPKLQRKISLPDSDREVIGLCLKRRNFSYNEPLSNFEQIKADLVELNQQVLTYNSNSYVQSLVNQDTWAAVGWSADFHEIVERFPHLKIVHPQEGTALWFDCWSIPQDLPDISMAYNWINYCLQPENSRLISTLTDGNGITVPAKSLTQEYLDRCELILELPPEVASQRQQIWQDLRQKT